MRWTQSATTLLSVLTDEDRLNLPAPFLIVHDKEGAHAASELYLDEDRQRLTLRVPERDFEIVLGWHAGASFIVFEVEAISSLNFDHLELFNFSFDRQWRAGRPEVCFVQHNETAIALFSISDFANSRSDSGETGVRLSTTLYPRLGVVGARVAFLVSRSGDFATDVQRLERETELPHPRVNGVWAKASREARQPYLFLSDLYESSPRMVDATLQFAKAGGFQQILLDRRAWSRTLGDYAIRSDHYPGGVNGLTRVVEKFHRAGLSVGMHVIVPGISAGSSYVTPVPDPRLAKTGKLNLSRPMGVDDTELLTDNDVDRAQHDNVVRLHIDDEIVTCQGMTPTGFDACERGSHGTRVSAHAAGAGKIGVLYERRGDYALDPDTDLLDEVVERVVEVFTRAGFDWIYLDGSERVPPPQWYYKTRVQMAVYKRLAGLGREVVIQASSFTNVTWHVMTRQATADPVREEVRAHVDRVRVPMMERLRHSWMPVDSGWFGIWSGSRPTTANDMEYYLAKSVGFDASVSLRTTARDLMGNPQTTRLLDLVRAWESVRDRSALSDSERVGLRTPGRAFHVIEASPDGWSVVSGERLVAHSLRPIVLMLAALVLLGVGVAAAFVRRRGRSFSG